MAHLDISVIKCEQQRQQMLAKLNSPHHFISYQIKNHLYGVQLKETTSCGELGDVLIIFTFLQCVFLLNTLLAFNDHHKV